MSDCMHYKGYTGSVEYSEPDNILYGKVLGISDLITYEGDSLEALQNDFQEAVDEYYADCKELGKKPSVPFSGQINTRVGHELHMALAMEAEKNKISQSALLKQILTERYAVDRQQQG